jgi:L-asparaginase II
MHNPVLIELTRGTLAESTHRGAFAVARADGEVVAGTGYLARPVFPRSAIKPLQALPFIESGAASRFGFGPPQIALACASHGGTEAHVGVVAAMLDRAGLKASALGCGMHEPLDAASQRELIRSGAPLTPLHHNCSGKHAAMLATAVHSWEPIEEYWLPEHRVQLRVKRALEEMGGARLGDDVCGIDGCSVPNWGMALASLAKAFAAFGSGEGLDPERASACRAIAQAFWTHPMLVAGPGRLDTLAMQLLPRRVLLKSGAEGVYCGALPERGLGFALKIDDGGKRAAEAVAVHIISKFYPEARQLGPEPRLTNWRGREVGAMRATEALEAALSHLS